MIDLLISCLVLQPFLTADIRLHSGDHEAGASEGHTGPSIYHATMDYETKERHDKAASSSSVLLNICSGPTRKSMLGQTHFFGSKAVYVLEFIVTYQHFPDEMM